MPSLKQSGDGCLLPIKAMPGSRKNEIRGWENERLKIAVTQVAEKGKANQAIIELLAKHLKVPRRSIEVVHGELHSNKLLLIHGQMAEELAQRIADLI